MKVYVAESDRGITGVYSTRERAEIAASSDGYVTEYELDEAFDLYDKGLRAFSVKMLYNGSVVEVTNCGYWTGLKAVASTTSANIFLDPFKWDCIHVITWARDDEHAIKIANEHRAEFVAAGWSGLDYFARPESHD